MRELYDNVKYRTISSNNNLQIMKKNKAIIIYILIVLLIGSIQLLGVTEIQENKTQDRFYQKGRLISPNIYVIGIDEETLSEYGEFNQWSRSKVADMINYLMEDPSCAPSVIAVDIGFFGEKDAEADAKLVEAVKNAGNVVLSETATFGSTVDTKSETLFYEVPFDALNEAASRGGHTNIDLDKDGVVRHGSGDVIYKNERHQSFDMAIYEEYLENIGEKFDENSPGAFGDKKFYITYSGKPRDYYGAVGAGCSFCRVLSGEYPKYAFKDSIVLIGAYASGMQDNYYTPIDSKTQMFGVEIHANVVNQLIDGEYKREMKGLLKVIPTLILGAAAVFTIIKFTVAVAVPIELLLSICYLFVTRAAYYTWNLILPILAPASVTILITILFIGLSYLEVYREKKEIIKNYSKYLSPDIAKTVAEQGEGGLTLGGSRRDIAVLFVDIRGFTSMSSTLPPEKVVDMLCAYFELTTSAIFNNQGTVDKFIGDATMGVFNSPVKIEDYTYKAVCAGLEMVRKAATIDEKLERNMRGMVGFGVGINCGEAVVGNVGTNFRMEYTAIGDTVNVASRLEGVAKAGTVVISEEVYDRVKDRIKCVDAGKVAIKGKTEPMQIYQAVEVL